MFLKLQKVPMSFHKFLQCISKFRNAQQFFYSISATLFTDGEDQFK